MGRREPRILALDPGTRYLGVAVLDGHGLAYYTVKDLRDRRPARECLRATRAVLGWLIEHYAPEVLAYERSFYVQSRESQLLQAQEREIRRVARAHGLRAIGYNPMTVRKRLCGDGWARKREVAERLARRYPDLACYLAPRGSRRERYWYHLFDAVAVGVVCLGGLAQPSPGRMHLAA